VAIVYLNEHDDAKQTKQLWNNKAPRHMTLGTLAKTFCQQAVQQTVDEFGKLDILVNNAAEQHPQESID